MDREKAALDMLGKLFSTCHSLVDDTLPKPLRASLPTYLKFLEREYNLLIEEYRVAHPVMHWCGIENCLDQPTSFDGHRKQWFCEFHKAIMH